MIMGIPFPEQTLDSFWQYCKDIAKHQGIKRPEGSKPKLKKTRKKQTPNGKHDTNPRPLASSDNLGEAKEDAGNLNPTGQQNPSSNKFLVTIGN